ncbi:MAG: alpha/beta fold hydrolase [Caldithrix sp.]|nr:alpha/beta fold hydrolase [Caldithrix sp.]
MTQTTVKRDQWVVLPKANASASLRLICLPFAGGTSNAFRNWTRYLPDSIELCAVELPGRGHRLSETLFRHIDPLIEQTARGIKSYLNKPFVIFGHSMGALTGFELTHHLLKEFALQPIHLFVSGRGAPHLPSREQPIHRLPDAEFVNKIRNYNGTPKEVIEHDELMDIMKPILRADFQVCETYEYTNQYAPFNHPITVFGGLKDSSTTREDLQAWKQYTHSFFNLRMFPGDHFYLQDSEVQVIETILRDISSHFDLRS